MKYDKIADIMPIKRYQKIRRNLHCEDTFSDLENLLGMGEKVVIALTQGRL